MNIKLIAEIGDEPVSVADVKANLRYTATDQDFYIEGLISAARTLAEIINGRKQVLSQWDIAFDCWPGTPGFNMSAMMADPYFDQWPSEAYRLDQAHCFNRQDIPLLPSLVSVQSLTYKDNTGTVNTLVENTDFVVDTWKEPGILALLPNGQWPTSGLWSTSAIHVQFTAGRVPDLPAYTQANPDLPVYPLQVTRNIKNGIMILVNQWFADRVPLDALRFVTEPPYQMTALFASDKKWV